MLKSKFLYKNLFALLKKLCVAKIEADRVIEQSELFADTLTKNIQKCI